MSNIKALEIKKKREELRALEDQMNILLNSFRTLSSQNADFENKKEEIHQNIDQIFYQMSMVRSELYVLENKPVASNEILDIYLETGSITQGYGNFEIFLHGTPTKIGHVRLNRDTDKVFGNIGAGLDEEYRGHHFMLQSLNLLKDTMLKMKIVKPMITVEPDNLASVKTIQAFGGILTEDHQEYNRYYDTYEVDLSDYESNKRKK